jgi:hypothetical protein
MNTRERLPSVSPEGVTHLKERKVLGINSPNAVETTKETRRVLVEMIRQAKVGG